MFRPGIIHVIALTLLGAAYPPPALGGDIDAVTFRRGDTNADGTIDISDAVRTLLHLFVGGVPEFECSDAADANDDGVIELSDAVFALNFSFHSGPAPPTPSATCGVDPTDDGLDCASFGPCGTGDDIATLSDEFDGDSLDDEWQVFRPKLIDLDVSGGSLILAAGQQSLWFRNSRGPMIFKLVDSNFCATSIVRARRNSNPSLPPQNNIHLGGLIARDPASGIGAAPENYVFIVVGNDVNDISVETKTTVDGESTFVGPSWPSGDAELQICRDGDVFRLSKREIGASEWTLAAEFNRPDLPSTLQVGPLIYANSGNPDLRVEFEAVRFQRPHAAPP